MPKTSAMVWRERHSKLHIVLTSDDPEEGFIMGAFLGIAEARGQAQRINGAVALFEKIGKSLRFIKLCDSYVVKELKDD